LPLPYVQSRPLMLVLEQAKVRDLEDERALVKTEG
jgi:hypothetical protein